jgi:hypothetical protein
LVWWNQQQMRADVQGSGNRFDDSESGVSPTTFEFTNIAVGKARRVREGFDRDAE